MASRGPRRFRSCERASSRGSFRSRDSPGTASRSPARRASQPPRKQAASAATAMPTMSATGVPEGAAVADAPAAGGIAAGAAAARGAAARGAGRLAGGGRGKPDARGGGERAHGGLGRRGQAASAGLDGDLAEHLVGGGGRVPLPVEAEPVGHHHEQPLRVREGKLDAEEAGVTGRLPPQLGDRAQVGRRGDDRHPDGEAAALRRGEQVAELHLLGDRDVRVRGHEQVLVDEHVAAGIAVGPGGGGEHAKRADGKDGEHDSEEDAAELRHGAIQPVGSRRGGPSRGKLRISCRISAAEAAVVPGC